MVFQYRKRGADAWEKRANQQGSEFQGIIKDEFKTFGPAKGDNFIRILPPTFDNAEHYGMDVYVHYSVGPDKATVLCLSKMLKEPCPICEARVKAERANDDELANELKASKRVLVWMIDRKEEGKGPLLWPMPWTLDRDFSKLARDPRSGEVYLIDHPEEGFDISFEKTGDGINTKYVGIQLARKASSVDSDIIDYIVKEPLDQTLVWRDYDDIQKMFRGGESARDRAADKPADSGADKGETAREQSQPSGERWRPPAKETADKPREEPPPPSSEREEPAPPREDKATPVDDSAKSKADALREKFKRR